MPDEIVFSKEHVLIARIVELAQRDPAIEQRLLALCETGLPPAKRLLLAKVIGNLGACPPLQQVSVSSMTETPPRSPSKSGN